MKNALDREHLVFVDLFSSRFCNQHRMIAIRCSTAHVRNDYEPKLDRKMPTAIRRTIVCEKNNIVSQNHPEHPSEDCSEQRRFRQIPVVELELYITTSMVCVLYMHTFTHVHGT